MSTPNTHDFRPVRFWGPRFNLSRLIRSSLQIGCPSAAVSMCIDLPTRPEPRGHHLVTYWTYDRDVHGDRLCIRFRSTEAYHKQHRRWQTFANALWRIVRRHPSLAFRDIPVDLGDGEIATIPENVFRFARRPGQPHDLLPNLYLLRPRSALPAPVPWERKANSIYFRGACTGSVDFWCNKRLAACQAARDIPGGDCRVTSFPEAPDHLIQRATQEGFKAPFEPVAAMNRHRFLLDIDGNTSSWDRSLLIGWFGAVPIRFEPEWEECWHAHALEGIHYVSATRLTLGTIMESLRADPVRSQAIAASAAELARKILSPENIDRMLEDAWIRRVARRA